MTDEEGRKSAPLQFFCSTELVANIMRALAIKVRNKS